MATSRLLGWRRLTHCAAVLLWVAPCSACCSPVVGNNASRASHRATASGSAPAEVHGLSPRDGSLLRQIETGAVVRRSTFVAAALPGDFLCAIKTYRRSGAKIFAAVRCSTYSLGRDATQLSGTRLPAVLHVTGRGAETEIAGIEFPRQAHLAQDEQRLFPPDVLTAIHRDETDAHSLRPTERELLAIARDR